MNRTQVVVFALLLFGLPLIHALAQEEPQEHIGIAEYAQITEGEVQNGHIVTFREGQYRLADAPYTSYLYGVINQNPAVAVSYVGREQAYPLIANGSAQVLVSAANGAIEPGDYITSSEQPGVGMKATQSGYILGTALAPYADEQNTGLIPIALEIKFLSSFDEEPLTPRAFANRVEEILRVGLRAVATEPNAALRYLAAALVLIVAIGFGFLAFGRSATNGVISIGRNPLARKSIFAMVTFNIVMTLAFVIAGLALGFFILAV